MGKPGVRKRDDRIVLIQIKSGAGVGDLIDGEGQAHGIFLEVVGVAGPGDSLANEETLEFFDKLGDKNPDLIKCMSTNGLLLPKYADRLAELGVNTVTVTVNAIDPKIAENIYSFIKYDGKIIKSF